jgi:hypothetical protein
VKFSLLDRFRTRAGQPDDAAPQHTVQRAVDAERLGCSRFWVARGAARGYLEGTARLPVGLGGPVLPRPGVEELLDAYRRDFRPHRGSRPRVTAGGPATYDRAALAASDAAPARPLA